MPAVVRTPACHSRRFKGGGANGRRHRLTEPTTKALCQPPPQLPTHCPFPLLYMPPIFASATPCGSWLSHEVHFYTLACTLCLAPVSMACVLV